MCPFSPLATRASRIASALLTLILGIVPPGQAIKKAVADQWTETMVETSELLREKEYKPARRKLEKLADEMVEVLGPGVESAQLLAIVTVQRAIAEAGVGERADALWFWRVALALDPRVEKSDLSTFGDVVNLFFEPVPLMQYAPASGGPGIMTQPEVVHRVRPKFPYAAHAFGTKGALVVRAVIGLDGRPRFPTVAQSLSAASLTYAGLEAVRQMRFVPAKRDGVPSEVLYTLTINYDPKGK